MDDSPDEGKSLSFNSFKEGDGYFAYRSYFNSSFFIDPNTLLANESLLQFDERDNKYLEPVNRLHQKFKATLEFNQKRYRDQLAKDTVIFGLNISRLGAKGQIILLVASLSIMGVVLLVTFKTLFKSEQQLTSKQKKQLQKGQEKKAN